MDFIFSTSMGRFKFNLIKVVNLKSVVMCQQLWLFLPLCQILYHHMSYSYSKTLTYGKKLFFVNMCLIHMDTYVPTKIYGYFPWNYDHSLRILIWRVSLHVLKEDFKQTLKIERYENWRLQFLKGLFHCSRFWVCVMFYQWF